jgi:hypothetical protein
MASINHSLSISDTETFRELTVHQSSGDFNILASIFFSRLTIRGRNWDRTHNSLDTTYRLLYLLRLNFIRIRVWIQTSTLTLHIKNIKKICSQYNNQQPEDDSRVISRNVYIEYNSDNWKGPSNVCVMIQSLSYVIKPSKNQEWLRNYKSHHTVS